MAGDAELKIGSESIAKTTAALDSLIDKLEKLVQVETKVNQSNDKVEKGNTKAKNAIEAAAIAAQKATSIYNLQGKGLDKLSDSYADSLAAIKAQEAAAKKGIDTGSKEYEALLQNIQQQERSIVATKRLEEAKKQEVAANKASANATKTKTAEEKQAEAAAKSLETTLKNSNIAREKATSMMALEAKGLDRLSDEYAELKAEILAKEKAAKKGISTDSEAYKTILKNTKEVEKATAQQKRFRKEAQDAYKGSTQFTNGLDDMAKQAALVDGPLGGIASRLTTLSSILKSTGGLAGGIALAGLGVASTLVTKQLVQGIQVAADSEVSYRTLEEQLKSTGFAAGFTAQQLDTLARDVAMSTLNSTEGVRESITALTAFTSISGDVFEDAVRKAEDIAILRNSSTSQIIKKLGKVLENPVKEYKSLVELGIDFEKGQDKVIQKIQEENGLLAAQRFIMDEINKSVGNVAASQADTLRGDIDTFSQKWAEYFETLGSKALPTLRNVTQAGSDLLDVLNRIAETNIETSVREFRAEITQAAKQAGGLDKLAESTRENISKMEAKHLAEEVGSVNEVFHEFNVGIAEAKQGLLGLVGIETVIDTDLLSDSAQALQLEKEKLNEIEAAAKAAEKAEKARSKERRLASDQAIQDLKLRYENEEKLTNLFIETGNTSSQIYRKEKAQQDAIAAAKKDGLEFNEEVVAKYKEQFIKLSDLTEKRVTYNSILQKTKSLENQQSGIEREIELYKATAEGLSKNSDEYIKLAASLKTANEVRQMGKELTDDQIKKLNEENEALLKLQRSQRIYNALKATDANSPTAKNLEREIALQRIQLKGVEEGTEAYIRYRGALDAKNEAVEAGLVVGSKQYEQFMKNKQAIIEQEVAANKLKQTLAGGFVISTNGNALVEGTLAAITDAKTKALNSAVFDILPTLDEKGVGLSQEQIDAYLAKIKSQFTEKANSVLGEFGLIQYEGDRNTYAEGSEEALLAEKKEKLAEIERFARENELLETEAYLQRKKDLELSYEQQIADAKVEAWEKTEAAKALTDSAMLAGSISTGLETIAAVAGNNKKLAKLAKAFALYQASASLVTNISKASEKGFPENIPLIAGAIAQGAQVVAQARSLNEPSFAFGGVDINGAGTGRSDSIKANIARGESVITAPATAMYKDTLKRMNAGLPINRSGGGNTINASPTIVIQGDASENTVRAIDERLRAYEERVTQIAQGEATKTIQYEQEVGGFLNPI